MSIPVELIEQNPWWKKPDEIKLDKNIVALKESKIDWIPRIMYSFDLGTDIVYTLRGPRQVGKTTLLKRMIKNLLEGGVPPRQIFYFTCDLIDNPKSIVETVSKYLDAVRPSNERAYIFLDEVSSVRNWQKGIKYLHDKGRLTSTTVLLTGSHTLDIKKASERLPGRRGISEDVLDKIMLPMKFAEYTGTLNKDIRERILGHHLLSRGKRREMLFLLLEGKIPDEIKDLSFFSKELNLLFSDYLLTGGIAKVINEFLKQTYIPQSLYKTYLDVVIGDILAWNKRDSYLRQVVSRTVETLGSPVGWNTLKKGTDISSHNTVQQYIETLAASFVVIYLYHYTPSRHGPDYAKNKKMHFHDPFFFHAMRSWINRKDPFELALDYLKDPENVGVLVESVVADHLVRLAFQLCEQKQLFAYENSLFYWRGKNDREIDFVLCAPNKKVIPIEVKYQPDISRSDKYGLIDFMKNTGTPRGFILSKDTLEITRDTTIIPVWLFLLLV